MNVSHLDGRSVIASRGARWTRGARDPVRRPGLSTRTFHFDVAWGLADFTLGSFHGTWGHIWPSVAAFSDFVLLSCEHVAHRFR